MLRKIHLHGSLGEIVTKVFEFDVETAAEAVRAICVQFPAIERALRVGEYHVIRGEEDTGSDLDIDECIGFKLGDADLHIIPAIGGSKRGGALKVILGAVLVGAAFFLTAGAGLGAAIGVGGMTTGITGGQLAMMGVAMAISGISQMLTPESNESKSDDSFVLSGPTNAYEQGSVIPVVYGEVITGGVAISSGIDIEQIGIYSGGSQ